MRAERKICKKKNSYRATSYMSIGRGGGERERRRNRARELRLIDFAAVMRDVFFTKIHKLTLER